MNLDINLNKKDIQGLSNADAVAAFFSKLGYNTNARTPQTPGNLGITSDTVLKAIKRIELIADQENFLQVYLFEVKSVTISHIRALVNYFKNKVPYFLFVLTSDYERIDFVLLERILPEQSAKKSIGIKQVGIRPRPLTIDRKHGSSDEFRIALRVLRRFTYTESDALAQYDKIKNAYTIADWSEEFFNNKALFSDYYLKNRLPEEYEEWKVDPKPAFQELNRLLLPKIQQLRGQKEQILREEILEPVFKVLGFDWKVGKKAGSEDPEPDYYLQAPSGKETLAFCLAYPWGRHLDGKDPKDSESPNEDPSRLVVSLLESGEAPWAIVTNGKVWRLYTAKTHSKASNYYEIDLEEVLVHSGQTDAYADFFKYFWLFFRHQAFQATPPDTEEGSETACFLDRLLTESEQYAKELGERLKEQVFEQIFPHLAEGFIVHIREKEGKDVEFSPERLDQVFQGTLTFLYRLLFLLYAEARDLLPVKEMRGYFEASLTRIKTEIAEAAGNLEEEAPKNLKKAYSKNEYSLQERLTRLFAVVDAGNPDLNVPVYNGGLFLNTVHPEDQSAEAHNTRFLNTHQVPDQYLALALNLLTRDIDPKTEALVSIDFKSLGVRQLGSIYEGLLEFKVQVAPEKMAVVKGKKTEEIVPYKTAKDDDLKIVTIGRGRNAVDKVYPKGAVYLENDKHERKATGSYYTPDHIVKYIVENAVGPVLAEKFEQTMRPKLREAQQAYREAQKREAAFKKEKMKGDDPEKVAHTYRHVVDELFNVKVLDPAMGSGHFLVEAVDFITDKAIHFLNAFPWNPVTRYLEETRRTILEEMDKQGVSIDPARLTDINLLKRHVLKRCIYGVDLNPMAVELAKVSLWLNCFTLGAPLSFLDHHMKCGNSLIGSKVEEAQQAIEKGQTLLFGGNHFKGLMLATQLMRHVGELSDVTSAQVQESKKEYKEAWDKLLPFKRILDVYTSQWFSNPPVKSGKGKIKTEFSKAKNFLMSQDCEAWLEGHLSIQGMSKDNQVIVQSALADSEENHFFHWELEFPEVFYGPKPGTTQAIERLENGGFDSIVGNPPYSYRKSTDESNRVFYEINFSCCEGNYETYKFVLELCSRLINHKGIFGLIVSSTFFVQPSFKKLRYLLLSELSLDILVPLGPKVFEEATVDTTIIICKKENLNLNHKTQIIVPEFIENLLLCPSYQITQDRFRNNENQIFDYKLTDEDAEIQKRLFLNFPCLEEFYDLGVGINTGYIKNELVSDSQIDDRYHPMVTGKGISRYGSVKSEDWILYDREYVRGRGKLGRTLPPEDLLSSEKLLVVRTRNLSLKRRVIATYDDSGTYNLNRLSNIISKDDNSLLGLLGIINSSLFNWLFSTRYFDYEIKPIYLRKSPLANPNQPELINMVLALLEIKKNNFTEISASELNNIEMEATRIEMEINNLVCELYGLAGSEINLINKFDQF
ncbi:MAG: BREX-1 system adenine-specific DNA-methyltransferase PglX [Nitrospinota bacterium]|nr:BREX-1 system adenine-specific DNA-methyltransferase PglX [Nitrospinota bacterium]